MEVLEFGCGTGTTAIIHASYVKHIRAIDFSEKMIEIAKDKALANGIKNITFEQNQIEKIDESNLSFDVVMAHSILHLLKDKESVIAMVFKMLKPGGLFISSTMCVGNTAGFFKYVAPLIKFIGLPLIRVFNIEQLIKSMTNAGFEIDYQWSPGKDKAVFIIAKKPL